MIRGVLESQAPPKQTATETIETYGDRLASASLLEDRRSAIQGLRSLAKQFPASVASKSLRPLIATLAKDSDDVDTARIVLETLLALFNSNDDSPEASDDIALWLADEFSQREQNVSVLLEYLEKGDRYTTLFSLQLLSAISSARLERTQECILAAPLGTARLVGTLDDSWEPIRAACLLLLNDITSGSVELQKIVAFESAFERIFNLIQVEGGLALGGIVVQDCLALLGNLIYLNQANQALFRESGFVSRIPKLLGLEADDELNGEEEEQPSSSRDRNYYGLLKVLRMFVEPGSSAIQANQLAFEKNGVLTAAVYLAFNSEIGTPVRAEALRLSSEIIRGNSMIQVRFGQSMLDLAKTKPQTNGDHPQSNGDQESAYMIEALLDLTLSPKPISMFDLRFAACECIQAYFYNNNQIRLHFLGRAISGHADVEPHNVLTILIGGPQASEQYDPYRLWFSAIITLKLLFDETEAKNMLMTVQEGDAANGEEVVTCIQTLTGNLITALQSGEDDRTCIAYLLLLCAWCFDDTDAVNDLLGEGSAVRTLVQRVAKKGPSNEVTDGLCVFLLGILYEFSTKDSPLPRGKLQQVIMSGIGRDQIRHKIKLLRENENVREFEVKPQDAEILFDQEFVDFLKDNFSRITRAIDRDPNLEVNVHEVAVDRNLADEVKRLEHELKQAHADQQSARESETGKDNELQEALASMRKEKDRAKDLQDQLSDTVDGFRKVQASKGEADKAVQDREKQLKERDQQIQSLDSRLKAVDARAKDLDRQLKEYGTRQGQAQREKQTLQDSIWNHENKAKTAEQTEKQLRSTIEERERKVEQAEQKAIEKDQKLKELESQLKETSKKQGDVQKTADQLKSQIDDRDQKLKTAQDSLKKTENQVKDAEDRAKKAETHLKNAEERAKKAESRAKEAEDQAKTQAKSKASSGEADKRAKDAEEKEKKAREHSEALDKLLTGMKTKLAEARETADAKEKERESAQSELDDMLIVLGELEEKRSNDKKKLKELGAEVSDVEDDDEDEEEDDEDEEAEDGEKEEGKERSDERKSNGKVQAPNGDKKSSNQSKAHSKKESVEVNEDDVD